MEKSRKEKEIYEIQNLTEFCTMYNSEFLEMLAKNKFISFSRY